MDSVTGKHILLNVKSIYHNMKDGASNSCLS